MVPVEFLPASAQGRERNNEGGILMPEGELKQNRGQRIGLVVLAVVVFIILLLFVDL